MAHFYLIHKIITLLSSIHFISSVLYLCSVSDYLSGRMKKEFIKEVLYKYTNQSSFFIKYDLNFTLINQFTDSPFIYKHLYNNKKMLNNPLSTNELSQIKITKIEEIL